jgi:hypothetical protein
MDVALVAQRAQDLGGKAEIGEADSVGDRVAVVVVRCVRHNISELEIVPLYGAGNVAAPRRWPTRGTPGWTGMSRRLGTARGRLDVCHGSTGPKTGART